MSFWKKLFGGGEAGGAQSSEPAPVGEESYKGHTIKALIMPVGSEYQLAGQIEKDIDGELKTYKFVRADRLSSKEDLTAYAIAKGRQIIDEQGDHIYR